MTIKAPDDRSARVWMVTERRCATLLPDATRGYSAGSRRSACRLRQLEVRLLVSIGLSREELAAGIASAALRSARAGEPAGGRLEVRIRRAHGEAARNAGSGQQVGFVV